MGRGHVDFRHVRQQHQFSRPARRRLQRQLESLCIQSLDPYRHMAGRQGIHSPLPQRKQRLGLPLPRNAFRLLGALLRGGLLPADATGAHRLDPAAAGPAAEHDVRLGHSNHHHLHGNRHPDLHAAGRYRRRGLDRRHTGHHPDRGCPRLRRDPYLHHARRPRTTLRNRRGTRQIQPRQFLAVADRTDLLGGADLRPFQSICRTTASTRTTYSAI